MCQGQFDMELLYNPKIKTAPANPMNMAIPPIVGVGD
jgi:hypothetical protein